jgi:hypothetical protein
MDLSTTNKELLEIVLKGETVLCEIAEIPCYSQPGNVSEVVCSKEKRDGPD